MSSAAEEDNLIAEIHIGSGMRNQNNGLSSIRKLSQQTHHPAVKSRIETRCGLIQKQKAGVSHQLHTDTHPLSLTATELSHSRPPAMADLQHFKHPLYRVHLHFRIGKTQAGSKGKHLLNRQFLMENVVLRNKPHLWTKGINPMAKILTSYRYHPAISSRMACHCRKQARLTSTTSTHQSNQLPTINRERNIL